MKISIDVHGLSVPVDLHRTYHRKVPQPIEMDREKPQVNTPYFLVFAEKRRKDAILSKIKP